MDATTALREKLTEIKGLAPPAQYGLFLADEDPKKGVWLDPARTLEHYLLRENVSNFFLTGWLRNRLLSSELELVLHHTKNLV